MSLSIFFLILFAALLHASWNALIKTGNDRLVAMAILSGSGGLIGLVLIPFYALPPAEAWPFIIATSFIHVGYIWFLTLAYEHGDFGEVYPVARGFAPLLTALGAMVFGGEIVEGWSLAGVVLIAGGIISLAFSGRMSAAKNGDPRKSLRPIAYALATSGFIASYTLVDGFGARASGDVKAYTAWLFMLHGLPLFVVTWFLRRGRLMSAFAANWKAGVLGGALSFAAYWIVLWAFTMGAMAPVAALRETSVVFAAIISAVLLKEGFGWQRVASASVVALGIVLLAF